MVVGVNDEDAKSVPQPKRRWVRPTAYIISLPSLTVTPLAVIIPSKTSLSVITEDKTCSGE